MGVEIQRVSTGYAPREHQHQLHGKLKRFNVLVCHRRFGKTVFSINEMIDKALRNPLKNPQYAYFAPTYGQAKRVAWDYFKDFTSVIPGQTPNEAEIRIDIPRPAMGDRVRFMLLGAENPGSLKGIYLDGAILDEYAEMDPIVWGQVIRPALADRKGWAIFIGTPKGENQFYKIYEDAGKLADKGWFRAMYKASETNIIDKEELEAAKREMTDEEYEQEFECSFTAAIVGAYYGKYIENAEKDGRIVENLTFKPSMPVDTFWDIGMRDSTAIWYLQQFGPDKFHLIDYDEFSGQGLEFYVKLMQNKPYIYRDIVWPHDGNVREWGSGQSRQDKMKELIGTYPEVLEKVDLADQIHAVRMILPICHFDKIKCERGINALKHYSRKWDNKEKIFKATPHHNWASHGASAFASLALGHKSYHNRMNMKNLPRQASLDYDPFGG